MTTAGYRQVKRRLVDLLDRLEDADVIVSLRNEQGTHERRSRVLERSGAGSDDASLTPRPISESRYFRFDGSELPADQHPAQFTHRTGVAQSDVIIGTMVASGETRWLQVAYTPLTEGPTGWSVLGIGMDVTALARGQFTPAYDSARLGTQLRARRRTLRMSQATLAAAACVGQPTLSNYELGKRDIPLPVYLKMCHALDVPPLGLLAQGDDGTSKA
jgi:DNA-binding XRE family transcriptional regulator